MNHTTKTNQYVFKINSPQEREADILLLNYGKFINKKLKSSFIIHVNTRTHTSLSVHLKKRGKYFYLILQYNYHLILYFKTYIHILVGFIIVYENVDIKFSAHNTFLE